MTVGTIDWRRLLVFTHRWLGIVGGLLFVTWFVSGIVLMYAGMPSLSESERLRRLPPLDLARIAVAPDEALDAVRASPRRVVISMVGERPAYRFSHRGRWTTVYADSGQRLVGLSRDQAVETA
ncbi:MAG: PepSY domain-containing protein, partial [Vicinamibacterales bacterium]